MGTVNSFELKSKRWWKNAGETVTIIKNEDKENDNFIEMIIRTVGDHEIVINSYDVALSFEEANLLLNILFEFIESFDTIVRILKFFFLK